MIINFLKKRIINTIKYSLSGLKATWKLEQAFKIEIIACLFGIYIIIFSSTTKIEKILLINSLFLILITELINTGLEKTINKISKEIHPISKIVKDIGSAAVFLSLIYAIIIWSIIFFKPIFYLFLK